MFKSKYRVKKGETPVSIAKNFGIEMDDLLKDNPGAAPFTTGQTINVPKPTVLRGPMAKPGQWTPPTPIDFSKPIQNFVTQMGKTSRAEYQKSGYQGSYTDYYFDALNKAFFGTTEPAPKPVYPGIASTNTTHYQSTGQKPPTYNPEGVIATLTQLIDSGDPVITLGDKALTSVYTPQQAIAEGWEYDPLTKTWSIQNDTAPAPSGHWSDPKTGMYQNTAGTKGNRSGNTVRNKHGTRVMSRGERRAQKERAKQNHPKEAEKPTETGNAVNQGINWRV